MINIADANALERRVDKDIEGYALNLAFDALCAKPALTGNRVQDDLTLKHSVMRIAKLFPYDGDVTEGDYSRFVKKATDLLREAPDKKAFLQKVFEKLEQSTDKDGVVTKLPEAVD